MRKIGVLTSGGDAPGMNAAIMSIAKSASRYGMPLVGIKRGYNGLLRKSTSIKEDMQDSERGNCGGFSVLWKSQTRRQFQPKEFEKAHPEIDLRPYYKHTTSRPFKITQLPQAAV